LNKNQKILNRASNQAYINHCLTVKLKYKDKWLINSTPMSHPIYIAYETEFSKASYKQIRKKLRKNYRTLEELKNLKQKLVEDNAIKYFTIFNEDIKYYDR
jgi:hypothetical protein